ncbi:hypothetical protein [Caulobacter endophyticus]|uniref:Uncharacterized protein n=1 Tax=Caulobacter endophyticus TaxID=2172652 RepID=A0A2T9JMD2_9CAUL|nr:hypothetical protein [Caulobacter endophyticus]PVM84855.1 hypothetical protein DDF67_18300 [Caulobacter endophyticus]
MKIIYSQGPAPGYKFWYGLKGGEDPTFVDLRIGNRPKVQITSKGYDFPLYIEIPEDADGEYLTVWASSGGQNRDNVSLRIEPDPFMEDFTHFDAEKRRAMRDYMVLSARPMGRDR